MQNGSYDETTIKDFLARMIDGWNSGDAAEFAAPFSEGADFIAFEGTHLRGRAQIMKFHQPLFDRELKGTRLEGGVKFVHFLGPAVAVMHAWGTTTLAGQTNASSSRDSMQLFVVTKHDGEWHFEAMLNARRITLDQQLFLDQFATLSAGDQREVKQRVTSMRH
ncbi:MAG TPA: SgcJ/EcaC family oxidoreductase [Steroidobacteraceae bacterium]|jgi:uncharacterized protein (TIGR02246 family)|nr:SgcJ/EcaC family oxidoreductase [Steroidobacteraceae bacterium]